MTAEEHLKVAEEHIQSAKLLINRPSNDGYSYDDGYSYIEVMGKKVKVLDHARTLYKHAHPSWIDDQYLNDVDQIEVAPDSFYLIHWKGTKKAAVVFPADHNHHQWRIQEFVADHYIKQFLIANNEWN